MQKVNKLMLLTVAGLCFHGNIVIKNLLLFLWFVTMNIGENYVPTLKQL